MLLEHKIDKEYFRRNYAGFVFTVRTYCALQEVYKNHPDVELNEDKDFQNEFSRFYMMRFVSKDFRLTFFKKMQELRGETKYNIEDLIDELKDDGKSQVSFSTKLLSMMNDEKYPIWDSNVAYVFGFSSFSGHNYDIITATYSELLKSHKKLIREFRDVFGVPSSNEISDMRILDFIIWKLGAKIKPSPSPKNNFE